MIRIAAIAVCGLILASSNDCNHKKPDVKPEPTPVKTVDDCPHCEGNQTAKDDGTCPMCGMQVK